MSPTPRPPDGDEAFAPDAFDYDLPPERIAQRPLARRSASRLMLLAGGAPPRHHRFAELPELLRPGDLLVRNVTRVFPARLLGRRRGGGRTEVLLVREIAPDRWECLARPTSHLKEGRGVRVGPADELVATVVEKRGAGRVIMDLAVADPARTVAEAIRRFGATPLPPYIERPEGPDAVDRDRYQTVYARETGAVAAPTAGLHFTPAIFAGLQERGVEVADLVLHVGPGTFRPVKVRDVRDHPMDEEPYEIPPETAAAVNAARREGRRIIAVGTTTTRALEAAADAAGTVRTGPGATDLFIRPGYEFRAIDGLITNFHLPRSTLLMLVSALVGRERLLAAYAEAVREGYRFYSYGDAMLLLPGGEEET